MKSRTAGLVIPLVLGLLLAPLAAEAQPPGKAARIGLLSGGAPAPHLVDAFKQGLRALGYVEGQSVAFEPRWAEGKLGRLPDLAAELVRLKVDAIVTSGTPAAHAAKRATSGIPIVMAQINDPVDLGLVASLAKPGGNITGLATLHSELGAKQLELLKEAVHRASRVALLWNATDAGAALVVRQVGQAAQRLGVTLHHVEVRARGDFEGTFAAMVKEGAQALLLPPDPVFLAHGKQLVDLAARSRLPAVYGWRELVEAGGLMAYGPSVADSYRRAAAYVDKILKGAKPADLPVEQPTKFELVINLKTAKALGLTIPQSLLLRADEVIQ